MFRLVAFCASLLAVSVSHAATFTVTTTADSAGTTCAATCSLRQALGAAGLAVGVDTIAFNIPGAGPHRIALASGLPATNDVIIDGYTQPGALANTHAHASNAVLKIIVDGRTLTQTMMAVNTGAVRGLSLIGPAAHAALSLTNGGSVAGCWFGVEPNGVSTVANGIGLVANGAGTHTVGGPALADRNVFVLAGQAVRFDSAAVGANSVRNNIIGLLPNGSTPAAVGFGITSVGNLSSQSVIANTLSCTGATAVQVFGRVFEQNRFGTTTDGSGDPGCSTGRIATTSGASYSFNTFGHFATSPLQVAATATGIVLRSNRVIGGTAVPFDLNNNGFSFNDETDADTGANNLQNYPTLTESRHIDDDNVLLAGQLRSTPNTSFALEFFASPEITRSVANAFALANAERVSTGTIQVTTDASGIASFGPVPVEFDGSGALGAVVGTATRLDGLGIGVETSEYGQASAVYVQSSGDFVVTNTNSSGPGSLFRALLEAQARPDGATRDRVVFAIPGPGPHTLGLGVVSEPILDGAIEIDGYTQPGALANSAAAGSNAQLKIDLSNVRVALRNANSLLKGVVMRGPSNLLFLNGATLEGSFIGVSVDGTALATTNAGTSQITCDGPCRIGGPTLAARNVIGCPQQINAMSCVSIRQLGATGPALVEGNLIGVSADGVSRLVTPVDNGASQIPIGIEVSRQFTTLRGNVVGGLVNGIRVIAVGNVTIENNRIGVGADGLAAVGNARHGIAIESANATVVGNLIAHNNRDGVLVAGGTLTTLVDNKIHSNNELAVDLDMTFAGPFGDGVTPNDPGDVDTGSNDGQNFPVLSNVRRTAGGVTADVSLNSLPSRQYRLRYCFVAVPDAGGHGECDDPTLVSHVVSTDASGNFSGTAPLLPATTLGHLTASAGRLQGAFEASSEFAQTVPIADVTTTTVNANPSPSVFGQPIAVNVSVAGFIAVPVGTVAIAASNGGSCNATLSAGTGSCQLTPAGAGAITLTAAYPGASGFTSSIGTTTHLVERAPTTLSIQSDTPDPSTFGDAITVTFAVQSTPAANGTVIVSDGVGGQCSAALAGGTGNCVLTPGAGGALTLVANYAETENFLASSDTEAHQVNAVASTLAILSDTPDPSVFGQAVNVAAQLSSAVGTPAGPIVISDGAGASCEIAGASGNCNLIPANAGNITLRADFLGNGTHLQSTASTTHAVDRATTTLTPGTPTASDGNLPRQFAPMRFPIAIGVGAPGSGAPSGSITVIGTPGVEVCALTLPAPSCDLVVQTPGPRSFTVQYPGDARFLPSSTEITVDVRADALFRSGFEETD